MLLNGVNHVAILTKDTDRLVAFYRDVFDGELFRHFHLRELGLFKSCRDVALHLTLDGVQLTKLRTFDTTPVILCNLNLLPEERYKSENILMSLIIPGPKKYRDLNSFLRPLVDELLQLGRGVQAYDGDSRRHFELHSWVILVTGKC